MTTPFKVVMSIVVVFLVIMFLLFVSIKSSGDRIVYMDNNGTTKIYKESLDLMSFVYANYYGNASGVYELGAKSKRLLEGCREKLAKLLGADTCELFFTSGATESNNIAIRGIYSKHKEKGKHIITTSIEHPSVNETVKTLEGAEVTFLPVDRFGKINTRELENSIRKDTVLVAVIMGNNEIGTMQDMKEIARICRAKKVHLHCDMTQVIGKYIVSMHELGIDSATGSGHKFHGPKASGFLYLKKGTYFESCISGGHQEKNIRSGTENIPGIVAMCYSLYLCHKRIRAGQAGYIKQMRDWMVHELVSRVPGILINGHPTDSLYNTLSVCLPVNSRKVVQMLDKQNICVNTGSACSKGSASSILDAIGVPKEAQEGSLRISLGFLNTMADCQKTVSAIIACVKYLNNS